MEIPSAYIDEIFYYDGLWGVESHCGIKIIRKPDYTLVIATELYLTNPGTSVTSRIAELARQICREHKIKTDELKLFVHTPDRKSKLDFLKETFDLVKFEITENSFRNPKWKRIDKQEIDEMIAF